MIDNIVNNLENYSILRVENCEKNNWTKSSWRNFKISQQPKYKDKEHLEKIEKKVSKFFRKSILDFSSSKYN